MLGTFTEMLQNKKYYTAEQIFVVRGMDRCLLGRPAIQGLRLTEVKTIDEKVSRESVERSYPGLFKELGELEGEYRISLKEGFKPYALSEPRRFPIPLLPKVKAELERMERSNVIFRVDESTN